MRILDFAKDIECNFIVDSLYQEASIDFDNLNTTHAIMTNNIRSSLVESISSDIYIKHINSAYEAFKNMASVNTDEMISFFTSLFNKDASEDVDVSVKVRNISEIGKIKPQYLMKISTDLNINLDKITRGQSTDLFIEKLKSGNYENGIKREMVQTSLPLNMSKEDIVSSYSETLVDVSDEFIHSTIIPFIKSIPIVMKMIYNDVSTSEVYITKAYSEINMTIKAINRMIEQNGYDKQIKKIHIFLYNMISKFNKCVAYLTEMLIKKINAYSYNIVSFNELYATIRGFYPETVDSIKMESVMDDDIRSTEDHEICSSILTNGFGLFRRYITNKVEMEKNSIYNLINGVSSITNIDDIGVEYDDYIYTGIKEIFTNIRNSIDDLKMSLFVGKGLNESLSELGLDISLENSYSSAIASIENIDKYLNVVNSDKQSVALSIYKELISIDDNIINICEEAVNTKKVISSILEEINSLEDSPLSQIEIDDIIDYVTNSLNVDYSDLCTAIGRHLINRAISLLDVLQNLTIDINDTDGVEELDELGYFKIELESAIDVIDSYIEKEYLEATAQFKSELDYIKKGITVVYEASEDMSAKIESLKSFANKILTEFRKRVTDLTTKHGKWIQDEEDKLLSLDTTGITINMLPYSGFNPKEIPNLIKRASSSLNSLNPSTIYQQDRNAIQKQIYSFLPEKMDVPSDDLSLKVKTYFMIGNRPNKPIDISGQKVSAAIKGMIDYCKNYEALSNSVESALKEFTNSADRKVNQLSKSKSSIKNVNESVEDIMLEEGEQQQNPPAKNENKKDIVTVNRPMKPNDSQKPDDKNSGTKTGTTNNNKQASIISTDARTFSRCAVIALETRYVDYINRLRALISKTKS